MGFFSRMASFFGRSAPAPNTTPNGGDGVMAFGGFLPSNENNPALTHPRKWITYANAQNTAIVATGLRYTLGLLGGTEWHAEPNPRGGDDARRAADIVTEGLLDNPNLTKPWRSVVRKQAMHIYNGFALHEWTVRRRPDGMVVFADIGHRPAHTIEQWDKPDERQPWRAVGQRTQHGSRWVIPRERLFYCVDDTLTDSPDGVGLFRHIVEHVRRIGVLEGLEILAYETDLRGMPIGRAPMRALRDEIASERGLDKNSDAVRQAIGERTRVLLDQLKGMFKSPDKPQYLLLDSGSARQPDGSLTGARDWDLELLRGEAPGVEHVAAAIGRCQIEIARVMGIEFAMVGGAESAGSYGMHADKTAMLTVALQNVLSEIGSAGKRDLARNLVALNGFDPDTCTPDLIAEPISAGDIATMANVLATMAGLNPKDEAINVLRKRMRLPPAPEIEAGLLGQVPAIGPPDPAIGERDVNLDGVEAPGQAPIKPGQLSPVADGNRPEQPPARE